MVKSQGTDDLKTESNHGSKPLMLSAVSGKGVQEALFAIVKVIERENRSEAEAKEPVQPWRP